MSDSKIIGGEFRIAPELLDIDARNDISPVYSLGRTCLYTILYYLIGDNTEKNSILLPDFLCFSVAEVPKRLGMSIKHYHIDCDCLPDYESIEKNIKGCLCIVLISYFGLIDLEATIEKIRENHPDVKIIVDDAQNFYGVREHNDYDYCFTSYRKWFCVPDGADIFCKKDELKQAKYLTDPRYSDYKLGGNIIKNYSRWINDEVYLELLEKAESMMDNEYRYMSSAISGRIINRLDFDIIKNARQRNAACIHKGLLQLGIRHLYDERKTPLFIPIFIADRDKLRSKLFSENIFSPVHWPVSDPLLQGENRLYDTELSLIIDQRYDEEDMERTIRVIQDAI